MVVGIQWSIFGVRKGVRQKGTKKIMRIVMCNSMSSQVEANTSQWTLMMARRPKKKKLSYTATPGGPMCSSEVLPGEIFIIV